MLIYTTYFAKLNKLPKDIVPIAICGKVPEWYTGFRYKPLAPKYTFFMEWKKNRDNNYYIEHFNKEVLDKLDADEVVNDHLRLSNSRMFALVCYEKPAEFCHRHLVADWLINNGYACDEF